MRAPSRPISYIMSAVLLAALVLSQAGAGEASPDYAKERLARYARLTAPYGWFSLVALGWIRPGLTTAGNAAGNRIELPCPPARLMELQLVNDKVSLVSADSTLQLHNGPAPLHQPLPEDEGDASALVSGRLHMWVIDRGGKKYLRVKDPDAPARLHAHPLRWYYPDARFRVTAQWIPYSTPHTLRVLNELDQVSTEPVPGYAEFTLQGHTVRLLPMIEDGNLFFVFRDTTSESTTYAAGRFLTVAPPPGGMNTAGKLVLDFNQAVNPPCAYSSYATCPVASPENRLPFAIPAGEQRYD